MNRKQIIKSSMFRGKRNMMSERKEKAKQDDKILHSV